LIHDDSSENKITSAHFDEFFIRYKV
jgi:hypothetical protein